MPVATKDETFYEVTEDAIVSILRRHRKVINRWRFVTFLTGKNMSKEEKSTGEPIARRSYLKYVGAVVVVAVVGGGAYYAYQASLPKPKTTVKFMMGSWATQVTDKWWDDFLKSRPDYADAFDVKKIYAGGDEYRDVLATAVGAGTPPDIFHNWNGLRDHEWLVGEKVSRPLPFDEKGWANLFQGGNDNLLVKTSTYDGKHYGFPYSQNARMMLVNSDVLSKCGVELTGDSWSYDELDDICAKVKASGLVEAPMALQNKNTWMPSTIWGSCMEEILGPDDAMKLWHSWFPGTTDYLEWTDPRCVEAMNVVANWSKKGYFLPGMNETASEDIYGALGSKKCAIMLICDIAAASIKPAVPADVFQALRYIPFPSLPEHTKRHAKLITWGDVYEVSSKSSDAVLQLAGDWFEFIAKEDQFKYKVQIQANFSPIAAFWVDPTKYFKPEELVYFQPFITEFKVGNTFPVLDLELSEKVCDANYRACIDGYSLARPPEDCLADIEKASKASRESK